MAGCVWMYSGHLHVIELYSCVCAWWVSCLSFPVLTGRWRPLGAEPAVSGVFVSVHLRLRSARVLLVCDRPGAAQPLVSTAQRAAS